MGLSDLRTKGSGVDGWTMWFGTTGGRDRRKDNHATLKVIPPSLRMALEVCDHKKGEGKIDK